MPSVDEPVRALRRLLRTDPSIAGEPRRLGRGLLDLLPHDDRAVLLLTTAAEVGVPALVAGGLLAEARRTLIDRAGLHPETAGWVVDVWHRAGTDDLFGPVRLAAWPHGTLLVTTRDARGVFAATAGPSGPSPWRLLASGSGAGSLAVSADGDRIVVAWAQSEALYAVEARHHDGALEVDPPEPVTGARAGLTPRAPLAILAVDETLHHLVWPAGDSGRLRLGTWRSWPSDDPDEDLPPAGAGVTALDVGRAAPGVAVLVAATDRGRVLTARWDVPAEHVGPWRATALPAGAVAAAGPRVFAESADGGIVDAAGVLVRAGNGERLVAATATGDTAWLATVAADTLIISRPGSDAHWSLRAP